RTKRSGEAKAASPLVPRNGFGRALRKRNGRAVAVGADGEHARRGVRRVRVRRPARRRGRDRGHERTGDLVLAVGHLGRESREASGAEIGRASCRERVEKERGGVRVKENLSLGEKSELLDVGIQR